MFQNDLSDPEVRRRLAQNYVQEAFFTEKYNSRKLNKLTLELFNVYSIFQQSSH